MLPIINTFIILILYSITNWVGRGATPSSTDRLTKCPGAVVPSESDTTRPGRHCSFGRVLGSSTFVGTAAAAQSMPEPDKAVSKRPVVLSSSTTPLQRDGGGGGGARRGCMPVYNFTSINLVVHAIRYTGWCNE